MSIKHVDIIELGRSGENCLISMTDLSQRTNTVFSTKEGGFQTRYSQKNGIKRKILKGFY
jgi:hypothetical protein